MKKLVYGVGINDADYVIHIEKVYTENGKNVRKVLWSCLFYRTWFRMIERGYSQNKKANYPTYKDVTVCEEWLRFSIFKDWMEKQDFKGKQLDKDLLILGNKVYRPEACIFVSRQVNLFLTESGAIRGKYKIGVTRSRDIGKFKAICSNPTTGLNEYIGLFLTEQEAHEAWLAKKLEHAYTLAALQTDGRIAKALTDRYENYKSS